MQLDHYLKQTRIHLPDFAAAIGVSKEALRRYRSGDRVPEWPVLVRLDRVTRGSVTPNDFLPLARRRERTAKVRIAAE